MHQKTKHVRKVLGDRLLENTPLSRYSTARVGGPASGLVIAETVDDIVELVNLFFEAETPYMILGEGSNILVSDAGYDGFVIINRTHQIEFDLASEPPTICVDTGVNLVSLSRKCAEQGLSGFEWACGIPGSVGGAIYGNAGANGLDINSSLISADVYHPGGVIETWPGEAFEFSYRSSVLKSELSPSIILKACFKMVKQTEVEINGQMAEFSAHRKETQPAGASLGSIFKNPHGHFAGKLIEDAGLKGIRIGGAEVSQKHANFIISGSHATAMDIYHLIQIVQAEVEKQFEVTLETEIELIGNFDVE